MEFSLYDSIRDSLVKDINGRDFLPNGKLTELITPERMHLEFQKIGCCDARDQSYRQELTKFVLDRAKRCFAILVVIEQISEIKSLYQNDLTDSHLPVAFEFKNGKCVVAKSLEPNGVPPPVADCPISKTFRTSWTRKRLDDFQDKQWLFLAPVFTENNWQRRFHTQCPLPFISTSQHALSRETLFSQVHQRVIHGDHIVGFGRDPNSREDHLVAVKELRQETDMGIRRTPLAELDADNADREKNSLETIRQLYHPHLIKTIATYERNGQHYFVFPWAENGNLREFWEKSNLLMHLHWVLKQLEGLCDALQKLHARNWRHGDLKPENILCFQGTGTEPGVLVIADVGLLKVQSVHTNLRSVPTRTMTGTWFYCPPQDKGSPRSRLYDLWSMGGIILEILICILYGHADVERLHKTIERFYVGEGTTGAHVHPEVEKWISYMYHDPRCGTSTEPTAIRLLLDLVHKRLLVVPIRHEQGVACVQTFVNDEPIMVDEQPDIPALIVSSDSTHDVPNQETTTYRADSTELLEIVRSIRERCISPGPRMLPLIHPSNLQRSYPGPPRTPSASNLSVSNIANVSNARETARLSASRNLQIPELETENSNDLDDVWESAPDNEFVRNLFEEMSSRLDELSANEISPKLCERCSGVNPWASRLSLEDSFSGFLEKSANCELCKMLVTALTSVTPMPNNQRVQIFTADSSFKLHHEAGRKILSMYTLPRDKGFEDLAPIAASVQFGFPRLPDAGSQAHFKILQEWLQICDKSHDCHATPQEFLPTRVLDVGKTDGRKSVRLFCRDQHKTTPATYVALSHRWGDPKEHRQFRTTLSNIADFEKHIDYNLLPETFQDAITITRKLGIRFLWIDSLCIVQDDASDWKTESQRMEAVFSSAYCTIAATCASGSTDGILKSRPLRDCVTLQTVGKPAVYVCQSIDDFQVDVEESELQNRGWVLQERALSSRTIHYTTRQAYWECGKGIRTETLSTMVNLKASFLGDANFPMSAEKYVKGGRIRLYEILYERYSKLAFTIIDDRPVAISGLEKRLLRTFDTDGGYGILERYLHRSLLWKRFDKPLTRIDSLRRQRIPSWSWMAYNGAINYMEIPFGTAEWSEDIQSPFSSQNKKEPFNTSNALLDRRELRVVVRDFIHRQGDFFFDEPGKQFDKGLRCVIFGKQKGKDKAEECQKRYVLIIVETDRIDDQPIYERVAVGYIASRDILPARSREIVVIR